MFGRFRKLGWSITLTDVVCKGTVIKWRRKQRHFQVLTDYSEALCYIQWGQRWIGGDVVVSDLIRAINFRVSGGSVMTSHLKSMAMFINGRGWLN